MRYRNKKKQFWFSFEESEVLAINSQKAGLSESEYIRKLVIGYKLKEKPDSEFYETMKLMRSISNNLNQIAKKAHTLNYIDEVAYQKQCDKMQDFIEEVKNKYLVRE